MPNNCIIAPKFSIDIQPPPIGTAMEGGYYVGRISIANTTYGLIVSPRSSGFKTFVAMKNDNTQDSLYTKSVNDGWSNTNNMADNTHGPAQWARALVINGHSDWYIPSRDEMEVLYRYFKPTTEQNSTATRPSKMNVDSSASNGTNDNSVPFGDAYTAISPNQTSVTLFKTNSSEAFYPFPVNAGIAAHWTSTEVLTGTSYWYMSTRTGLQNVFSKIGTSGEAWGVRAIRRVEYQEMMGRYNP